MMESSYRLTIKNAPTLKVVEASNSLQQERLPFRTCFMIWMGLIASSWAIIAVMVTLIY